MTELESLHQRLADARATGNALEVRNAFLDTFVVFGALATDLLAARNYAAAEQNLKTWAEELDQAKADLLPNQILFSHSRYQAACGSFQEIKGLESYFLHGDFVDAPRLLEQAEIHHERSAQCAGQVSFPPEAPPEARATQDKIQKMQQVEALRVRGMRLLVQGEFESEAGGLERAIALLHEAVATMKAAEADAPTDIPGDDPVAGILEKGQRELNFIDFAQALLHKTQSDAALLAGDFITAANQQSARAEALKRCQSMHLRAGQPLNEGFARRLARDVHVANLTYDTTVWRLKRTNALAGNG